MKKKALALLAAFCLLLTGCQQGENPQDAPELLEPVGVKTDRQAAYYGEISKLETYGAFVVPAVEPLSFEVSGRVSKVNVIIGQDVKKGDVLVELDQEDLEDQYADRKSEYDYTIRCNDYDNRLAQLNIDMLNLELDQLRKGNADGSLDREIQLKALDVRAAELTLRQSKEQQALGLSMQEAALAELEEKMGRNTIVAPFDGRIVYGTQIQRGDNVAAFSDLLYIADETQLFLEGDYIAESKLKVADRVYARIGKNEYDLTLRPVDEEEYVSVLLSGGTKTTRFDFTDETGTVAAGAYAAVCVETHHLDNVLLVPSNAVFSDAGSKYVYVYTDDESRERRDVATGLTTSWLTQITDGLEEGEEVYVAD